jgi:lipopolysaccharide transport system ATP-binding protein
MRPIIKVENVSKRYTLGAGNSAVYGSLREAVMTAARAPLQRLRGNRQAPADDSLWALCDLNLQIYPGERLGIIGRNGAGKSTLLKILSRITDPTNGRVELYGRVGSLLEVGTGFHPELSGRENVFLNGAILGMRRSEIERKFDEIVAFAEIEKFLDTPVKRYSSGMYTRLAFAVAAHLEPEILIVDEVLAVGDASFQKKCLGKMDEVASEGRTVIFVSHNLIAIQSLCDRAMWLHEGKMLADGQAQKVVSQYLKTSFSAQTERVWEDIATAPGDETVRLHGARVRPEGGGPSDPINVKTPLVMEFEYWILVPGPFSNLSVVVNTEQGFPIFNTGSDAPSAHGKPFQAGLFRSAFYIPGELLNDGTHRVHLYIIKDRSTVLFHLDDILVFDVEDLLDRHGWFGKWIGAVRPTFTWQTELVEGRTL